MRRDLLGTRVCHPARGLGWVVGVRRGWVEVKHDDDSCVSTYADGVSLKPAKRPHIIWHQGRLRMVVWREGLYLARKGFPTMVAPDDLTPAPRPEVEPGNWVRVLEALKIGKDGILRHTRTTVWDPLNTVDKVTDRYVWMGHSFYVVPEAIKLVAERRPPMEPPHGEATAVPYTEEMLKRSHDTC